MHPAPKFLETDRDTLIARMAAYPFALVCAVADGRPVVAHAPVIVSGEGVLRFHLARANPACRAILQTGRALVVFSGAHDYISPDWYGLDDQVGTWNYLSVEAEGDAIPMSEADTTILLDDLSDIFEAPLAPKPAWTRAKLDPAKFTRMLTAITGFRLTPDRLEGITKLGQYKSAEARRNVAAALKASGGDSTIASMMEPDQ